MFFRLLLESFRRQRRRKLLAGVAILLGTTAVTAMLALALTIGDRIHAELAVYGANLVVYPKADLLEVKIGGVDVKPATGGVYLHERDLERLKTIFWANNITGVSPELNLNVPGTVRGETETLPVTGLWFHNTFTDTLITGGPELHPWWHLRGAWPAAADQAVVGAGLARTRGLHIGDAVGLRGNGVNSSASKMVTITGIVSTGDATDDRLLLPLETAQAIAGAQGAVSRVDVSARTKPEDAFARKDPDSLPAAQREIWYCRPYANSIAYQIREAIPGAQAEQVRRVEQSEGTVLERISGLMWLISAAALLAAGFAVSAAMATAILERRAEIGLMRSLGASRGAIALLFYTETGVLAVLAGGVGYVIGSGLAAVLGARIFAGEAAGAGGVEWSTVLNPVLLPVVVGLALLVAIAGQYAVDSDGAAAGSDGDPEGGRMTLTLWSMLRRSMAHRRARSLSALVALTVSAGVATALLTLYADLDAKLHHEFRSFGANVVVTATSGASLPENVTARVRAAAGEDATVAEFGYAVATTDLPSKNGGTQVVVAGTDFAAVRRLDAWWSVDAWPAPGETDAALLGQRAAHFVADAHAVKLTYAGKPVVLHGVGRLRTGGDEDSRIYMPMAAFTAWTGAAPIVVEVQVPGGATKVEAAIARLKTALPGLQITPVRQLVEGESRIVDRTHALMYAAVVLIALTVGVSVLATLSASVLERRRDFALMKALGGSQGQLMGLFLLEALVLAMGGVAAGYVVGSGLAWAISEGNFGTATLPRLSVLPLVLALNLAVAVLAAILPVRMLRGLQPAALLKGE